MNPATTPTPLRTTAPRRARATMAAGTGLLLVAALTGCSKDKDASSSGDQKKTSTTAAVTTTTAAPLLKSAKTYGLAYLSTDTKGTTVFLTDGAGTKTDVVGKVKGQAEALRFSPDGSRLLLDGDAAGDFELQVVDVESGKITPLAPSATSNEGGATWSPDGRNVAFFSNRAGDFAGYVVPASGGEPVRITPPEATGVGDLMWSPDGGQLAFSSTSNVDSDVWVVAPDGSGAKKVSTVPGARQPVWSPDGKLLAFSAQPGGAETSGIFTLDPGTGTSTEVADTEYHDGFPVWDPDGRSLTFLAQVPNDDAEGGTADDVYRVDLDGGKPEPEPVIADAISIESEVSVTPDGKLIAFSVQRLGDKEVFVANADGSGAIPVSRSERIDAWAAWQPGTGPTGK